MPREQRANRRTGPVTWKISEYSTIRDNAPPPPDGKMYVRIGPFGVGKSATSSERRIMGIYSWIEDLYLPPESSSSV